jgi:hemerythrin-like metal-binding protein
LRALIARLRKVEHGPADGLQAALTEALKFARAHSQNEESAMAAVCYPRLGEHRAAHENIVYQLNQCAARARQGEAGAAAEAVRLLQHWLDQHFPDHDQRFHEYLVAFVLRRLLRPTRRRRPSSNGSAQSSRPPRTRRWS